MITIDKTYFAFPPCELPSIDETLGGDTSKVAKEIQRLNNTITRYTKDYLISVLGEDMYGIYIANSTDDIWVAFEAKFAVDESNKINPIANFIYCNYLRENETALTNRATATADKSENSDVVSIYPLYKKAWNEMVKMNESIFEWLLENKEDYEYSGLIDEEQVDYKLNYSGIITLTTPETYGI